MAARAYLGTPALAGMPVVTTSFSSSKKTESAPIQQIRTRFLHTQITNAVRNIRRLSNCSGHARLAPHQN